VLAENNEENRTSSMPTAVSDSVVTTNHFTASVYNGPTKMPNLSWYFPRSGRKAEFDVRHEVGFATRDRVRFSQSGCFVLAKVFFSTRAPQKVSQTAG
jgi:hypothetical protein